MMAAMWLSRIDKDSKEARDKRIFEMWLACWTAEEIGESVGMTSQGVGQVLKEAANLPKVSQPAAEHATDFDVPIYNIWKQQEKTAGASHFGNSEVRWVDNLLYLYTKPFDIVIDPFAGGGSTIDPDRAADGVRTAAARVCTSAGAPAGRAPSRRPGAGVTRRQGSRRGQVSAKTPGHCTRTQGGGKAKAGSGTGGKCGERLMGKAPQPSEGSSAAAS